MKNLLANRFISPYLDNRPLFYVFTRPREASLFQQNFPLDTPVLDFGCGDGFFASVCFDSPGKIDIGFDVDSQVKTEAEKSGFYQKVIISSRKDIPFKEGYFKTVISNCVFEHIPELDQSLKEIHRVLGKKGLLLTTVMTDSWEKNLLGPKIFGESYRLWLRKKQKHFNLLSEKEWIKTFKKNNFQVLKKSSYLNKNEQQFCELFHYLSFPNLFYRTIFGRWTLIKNWPLKHVAKALLSRKSRETEFACRFFALRKI